jgi:type VII secretion integral membrane protein EccD
VSEEQTQTRTWTSARLHVVLGDRSVDIAVPAEVPLVDLLPAVLPQFGAEAVEAAAEHEGWVVQRLGEAPLDEELTPAQLDLHDGETIHLRPRDAQLAPLDYDDIVAGAGEQVQRQAGAWTPARTRWMLLTGAAALIALGVPVLATGGTAVGALTGWVALLMTVLLLAGAALVARGAADALIGTVLAGLATAYIVTAAVLLCGALIPGLAGTAVLTVACSAAVAVLAIGVVVVADSALLFTGALTAMATLAVTGLIGSLAGLSASATSAVVLCLTIVAQLFVPSAAFRLSGLVLPLLPTSPEQLSEDIEPVPQEVVVERGAVTVAYTAALHIGFGTAQVPLLVAAATAGGWATVFALVTALLLMLRSRHPNGTAPRWAMLVPAGVAVVSAVVALSGATTLTVRMLAVLLPVLAVGAGVLWLVDVMPGRRLQPYWGRTVDIVESLTAVALVPVLLAVLGTYAWMRGLGG